MRFTSDIFARERIGSRIFGGIQIVKNPTCALLHRSLDDGCRAVRRRFNFDDSIGVDVNQDFGGKPIGGSNMVFRRSVAVSQCRDSHEPPQRGQLGSR